MNWKSLLLAILLVSCGGPNPGATSSVSEGEPLPLQYAKGFRARTLPSGVTLLTITQPWPGADRPYHYALVPRDKAGLVLPDTLDAVIPVPVRRVVLTSTTHIPALEILDAAETLIGFPGLSYISSPQTTQRIGRGEVAELGANEQLNTEKVLEVRPDLVVGFGITDAPRAYRGILGAGIPVIYNGDWTEQDPLGKAEWLKFFGLLLDKRQAAAAAFEQVEAEYLRVRELAATAVEKPTVLSGALYRDVWYLPGGQSWAARFLDDAHAAYLWRDTPGAGSLSLSLEAVLQEASEADFWVSPSQYTSYSQMEQADPHYARFKAFREKKVLTYAASKGPGGGLTYFELGPSRPDLILKDLIHYLHPGLLPDHEPVFYKPLDP